LRGRVAISGGRIGAVLAPDCDEQNDAEAGDHGDCEAFPTHHAPLPRSIMLIANMQR
jgi:hypothetical protein